MSEEQADCFADPTHCSHSTLAANQEQPNGPSVALVTAATATGRHVAAPCVSIALLQACRVPSTGVLTGTKSGIRYQGHRWMKTGLGARGDATVRSGFGRTEIPGGKKKYCTWLLREKAAFLSRNELNFPAVLPQLGEEHFPQA